MWLVGWYAVHMGGVYDFALRHPWFLNVEHLIMIAIGLLFWWPIISDVPNDTATLTRIAYVFAAFVLSAFLGLALTFAPSFYDYYATRPERLWGISVDADQNLGGILMTTEQAIVLFAAIVWLLLRSCSARRTRPRRALAARRSAQRDSATTERLARPLSGSFVGRRALSRARAPRTVPDWSSPVTWKSSTMYPSGSRK